MGTLMQVVPTAEHSQPFGNGADGRDRPRSVAYACDDALRLLLMLL
ncbi:MAG: hypothetical protein ACAF41_06975 [Leptolyngbya sp. BL-A-14]